MYVRGLNAKAFNPQFSIEIRRTGEYTNYFLSYKRLASMDPIKRFKLVNENDMHIPYKELLCLYSSMEEQRSCGTLVHAGLC